MAHDLLSKRHRRRSLSVVCAASFVSYASIVLTGDFSCNAELYHRFSAKIPARGLQENLFLRSQQEGTDVPKFSRQVAGDCTLDQNGFYGTVDTSSDIFEVQYLYQVSVVVGTTTTQLNNEIIEQLDDAITTAILPQFFVCDGRRRILQDSTVTAISSMPVDTYIFSGLNCAKTVPNTDCYVVQGLSTVIASGFSDESLESIFKEAVQVAIQGNTIVGTLNTTLVLDVSSLTDTLETSPPITIPPQAPIPATPSSPIASPVSTITFAPIPDPVAFPPSFSSPVLPSPTNSDAPSVAPTNVRRTTVPTFPKPSPTNMDDPSRSTENDAGLDWWSWLLIGGAALAALVCGYTVVKTRTDSGDAIPPPSRRGRDATVKKGDAPDTEDDEPLYEPPPTITPYFAPPENRSPDFSFVTPAPVVIPPVPDTSTTMAAPAFVLDAQEDEEEEEEEEEEDDEDYTLEDEEEEEDMEAGEDVHHDEGEVFEDEESYYEEEETEDDGDFEGGNPNVAWGNHQQPTFGGLY